MRFIKHLYTTVFSSIFFICCSISYAQIEIDLEFVKQKIIKVQNISKSKVIPVEFKIDESLPSEGFKIKVSSSKISVLGADGNGLLYGGLDIAEQIELNGVVRNKEEQPFLEKRGLKLNIPLDARTPSYDDSGDAAQVNIIEMWNFDFWREFLDQMALHRYNVLTLWNPHPFPSMIKLEDYPSIALDDVYATTLKPLGRENEWGEPQLVSDNVLNNLKKIKTISIDEKIEFWQRVMKYAKRRGIETYLITWNICPNSVAQPVHAYHKTYGIKLWDEKPGKYGISHQMNNPKTIAYYREAVKTFLLTYPDLKGIGVTAGEYMPPTWDGYNREQWLWETYGLGIIDAKKEQPDRTVPFIHRVWYSDMNQIMKYWEDYPDSFQVSFKYAKARVYSSPTPPFAKKHLKEMKPYKLKSWWNLRNDDIFVYRWGDPDYVKDFLRFFPKDETAGYYFGSDGYFWGREFISKMPELSGELEINKHWFNFMLWGRLGYNDKLSDEFFQKKIAQKFKGVNSKLLFETWKTASKIIPKVNMFHWRDWDHMWSVESCMARPVLGGFRTVIDFMDNPTMEGSNILNPRQFAENDSNNWSDKISPHQITSELRNYAKNCLMHSKELKQDKTASTETKALLGDIEAMAHLGNYYADKIDAATALAKYDNTKDKNHKEEAIERLNDALKHWILYAKISTKNYKPQMLARTNILDWNAIINHAKEDITLAKRR